MRPARVVLLLTVVTGCPASQPNPQPVEPAPEPPLARVHLDAPAAATPGPVSLTVHFDGDAAGQALAISARPPGAPRGELGTQWLSAGVAPASGTLLYLQGDGTFAATAPSSWPAAVEGSVALPLTTEGEWLVFARVLDGNGALRSQGSARVIISSKPAIALDVNRLTANSDDVVRAKVTLAAGSASQNVTLYAWLEPKGAPALALPDLGPHVTAIYSGPAINQTFDLFSERLTAGDWTVRTVLSDGSARLLGLSGARLSVCDLPQPVSGVVTEASKALSGASGTVVFRDVDDDDVETATLGADGSFSASLPPGRWLATARETDHAESAPVPFAVACSGMVNVALDVPTPALMASTGSPLHHRRDPLETLTRGKAALYALGSREANTSSDGALKLLLGRFAILVDNGSTALEVTTPADLAALLTVEDLNQRLGGDDLGILRAISDKRYDFTVSLHLSKSGSSTVVTARLTDVYTATPVWSDARTAADDNGLIPAVDALARSLLSVVGLEAQVERLQDWPVHPVLTLGVSPATLKGPGTFTATVLLTEKSDSRPEPMKTVTLTAGTQSQMVITDANGIASAMFNAPAGPATVTVTADYTRRGATETASKTVTSSTSSKVTVSFEEALAALEDDIAVDVMIADDAMRAGQAVQLMATGGRLDTAMVTTDSQGRATATFTPDGTELMPTVTAVALGETASAQVLVRPSCHNGTCAAPNDPNAPTRLILTADPSQQITDGTSAQVVADLRVSGNTFSGVAIDFAVVGGGSMSPAMATTDTTGLAHVNYTAPATGTGDATVTATAHVAGGDVRGTLVFHFQPPCAACPIMITAPDHVAKGGTAKATANLPVRWSTTGGLVSITSSGVITAGGTAGMAVITATTIDMPTRMATSGLWVSCDRADLTGDYTFTMSNVVVNPPFMPCMDTHDLTLFADTSDPQPSQVNFTVVTKSMVGSCHFDPFAPAAAFLGDQCDVSYSATNLPALSCGGLHFRLQATDNTLKTLAGTWLEDDTVNGCGVGRSADIRATR